VVRSSPRMSTSRIQGQSEVNRAAELSVVIAIGGQRERAARALASVLGQSCLDRLEILLYDLGPEGCPALPGSDHPKVKMARSGPDDLLSRARRRGIHSASAPMVCFMEEHCEMQPGCAEKIIAAQSDGWAAIGPDFTNGNPSAGKSDKVFRMNYGEYVRPPAPRGPTASVAGQNSAFRREVLLKYEPHLEFMLNAELVLQWKMQADGHRMFYEPGAVMAHKNETTFRSLATGAFYWNWCFSSIRAEMSQWSRFRRAAWIAASPLIPWVRLARISRQTARRGLRAFGRFLTDIPFILGISHASAAGQVAGLLNPIDRAAHAFSHFEMNEPRLSRADLRR
jgi:glycosyl transferase family 2